MISPIQGVDPRIAMKAAAAQLSALKLFADANGDVIAHAGVKVGSFSRDTSLASGTQAVTGVGFQPTGIIFLAVVSGTPQFSVGFSQGTSNFCIYDATPDGADTRSAYQTDSIILYNSIGNSNVANVSTYDTDGFTISWVKTGVPTGSALIIYMAFR